MSRDPRRFQPTLEFLDSRVVPAGGQVGLAWTDALGTGAFDTPENWLDLATGRTSLRAPQLDDVLEFDGTLTSDDCVGLHGFGQAELTGDYLSVSLVNGYAGTVEFVGDGTPGVTVGDFTMQSGAIAQASADTDLSVVGNFTWTGGTLNSTSNLANVTITGSTATATIAPTGGGTVSLGSTLNLSGGATGTFKEGTLNVMNDGLEMNVNANSALNVAPVAGGVAAVAGLFGPHIQIKPNGSLTIQSEQFSTNARVTNEGTLTLKPGT